MEFFKNRPLAVGAAIFVAISIALTSAPSWLKLSVIAAAAVILTLFILLPCFRFIMRRSPHVYFALTTKRATAIFATAAVITAAALSYRFYDIRLADIESLDGEPAVISAYVTKEIYEASYGGYYKIKITELDGKRVSIGCKLETEFSAALNPGDIITADVIFASLSRGGSFDERAYYLPRGIVIDAVATDAGSFLVTGDKTTPEIIFSRLNSRISSILDVMTESEGFGGDGIAAALFAGTRDGLDDEIYRDFKYVGASHLLAVSGLHLSVFIMGLERLLRKLTLHKTVKNLILIALTVIYMGITGFSASVLRAGIMLIIYFASHFVRREPDSATSLFISAGAIILFSPASAADAGLLLSVSAMMGCIASELFMPKRFDAWLKSVSRRGFIMKILSKTVRVIYMTAAISVSTLIFTLPVMWLTIGRVSLLSPISTLALSLPVQLIMYLCPIIVVVFLFSAVCAAPFAHVAGALCRLTADIASWLSGIDDAVVMLSADRIAESVLCVAVAVFLVAVIICGRRRATLMLLSAALCFMLTAAVGMISAAVSDDYSTGFYNNGKNDVVTVACGGKALICDITDGGKSAVNDAIAGLNDAGVYKINSILLTHLHMRHARQITSLCSREYVGRVILPMPETDEETVIFDSVTGAAAAHGTDVAAYKRGETVDFYDAAIKTLPRTMISRSSHPIITLTVDAGDATALYVGAATNEDALLYGYTLDMCRAADTVIFGAHGAKYKSGAVYYIDEMAHVIFASDEAREYIKTENYKRAG